MAKSNINIKGLKQLIKDLQDSESESFKRISATTEGSARDIEFLAKKYAPVDMGVLRQEIKAYDVDGLHWNITTNYLGNAPYSAYVEFGTGTKFKAPQELKEIASKFKGNKRGSFKDGLEAVEEWAKRKGLPKEAAYPIFLSIIKKGVKPQPYLYPAFVKGRKDYIKKLEKDLEIIFSK